MIIQIKEGVVINLISFMKMSSVYRIPFGTRELKTFTRTDISMVVLLPSSCPRLVRPPTRRSGSEGGLSSGGRAGSMPGAAVMLDITVRRQLAHSCHPARLGVPAL